MSIEERKRIYRESAAWAGMLISILYRYKESSNSNFLHDEFIALQKSYLLVFYPEIYLDD